MGTRILHVVESLAPEAGSVAVSLVGLFRALRTRDIEPVVVSSQPDDAASDGIRLHSSDKANTSQLVDEANLVHIHCWGTPLARATAAAARRAHRPYVISPYGALTPGPHNRAGVGDRLRRLLRDNGLIRRAAAVTALNEPEARDLRRRRMNRSVMSLACGLAFGD
jgi:hypothetical protein